MYESPSAIVLRGLLLLARLHRLGKRLMFRVQSSYVFGVFLYRLWAMMWPVLTKVKYELLGSIFSCRDVWGQLALSLIANWILGPAIMVRSLLALASILICPCLTSTLTDVPFTPVSNGDMAVHGKRLISGSPFVKIWT